MGLAIRWNVWVLIMQDGDDMLMCFDVVFVLQTTACSPCSPDPIRSSFVCAPSQDLCSVLSNALSASIPATPLA